jgi:cholesterol transport system auxiliary component
MAGVDEPGPAAPHHSFRQGRLMRARSASVSFPFRVPCGRRLQWPVVGLTALLLAGCGGGTPATTFDLSAPRDVRGGGRAQIVVAEPLATQVLDSERIVVREANGSISALPGVQWADRLPRLIQARLIQTFENAKQGAVGRPGDRVVADRQINIDLRAFDIRPQEGRAVVEMSVRLIDDRSGRVVASRIFSASTPSGSTDGAAAAQALDAALSDVLRQVVAWVR